MAILKIGNRLITVNGEVGNFIQNLEFKGKLRVTVSGGDFGLLNEGVHIVELDTVDTTGPQIKYSYQKGIVGGTLDGSGSRIMFGNNSTPYNNTYIEFAANTKKQIQTTTQQTYYNNTNYTNYTITNTNTITTYTHTMYDNYGHIRTTGAEVGKLSQNIFKSYTLTNGVTLTIEKYLE